MMNSHLPEVRLKRRGFIWLGQILGPILILLLGKLCRYRVIGREHLENLYNNGKPFIIALWHGRMLLPVYYFRRRGISALVSRSWDGELISRIVERLGYIPRRGSSREGGSEGYRAMLSDLRAGRIVAIFPDGPTGPRHQLKEGVIQLAKRSGAPILPISYSARPAKIFNSWDQFMVMLPFSRGVLIIGEPITIPHKVRTAPSGAKEMDDFKDEDFWKNFVCNALNEVECQADRLVMDLERFAVNEAEKKISDKGFPEEIF